VLSGQDEHVVFKYDEGLTTGQPWSHAGQLAALHHGVSEKYGAEHHGIGATQIEARYHNPPRVGRLNCVHLKYSIIAFLKGSYKKKKLSAGYDCTYWRSACFRRNVHNTLDAQSASTALKQMLDLISAIARCLRLR